MLAPRPDWQRALEAARADWGASPGAVLAIIYRESTFRADARPPHGPAYGWAQAKPATWGDYVRASGRGEARRDDFADAVHFVGWYMQRSRKAVRAGDDLRTHYLAYHEGWSGYRAGGWAQKAWLAQAADDVAALAARYDSQIAACAALSGWRENPRAATLPA